MVARAGFTQRQLVDLYSDYLIVNDSQCICTGLGQELGISHDHFTRMLNREALDSSFLWKECKGLVRSISSEKGVFSVGRYGRGETVFCIE